ncbi:MAG: polyphosphate kinase 1 [Terriglobia bacterium]|jgi:polyphosphate kinase
MSITPGGELDSLGAKGRVAVALSKAPSPAPTRSLDSPDLYINRELSLLEFQRRVLQEAQDAANPLLERVKFLAIVSSNLDEFFMVRVSALQKQVASGSRELGIDGRSAAAQLELIREQVKRLGGEAQKCLREDLQPALAREGIRILDFSSLSKEERASLDSYFLQHVFPILTPLAFDPGRPFPHISSRSLNLAVVVGDQDGMEHFARIKVPDTLHQLILGQSPSGDGKPTKPAPAEQSFVWLEQLLAANLNLLFPGMVVLEAYPFRVTRDAEVAIQELESDDLLESVEEAMRRRRFTSVVRLQVDSRMPDKILEILTSNLAVDPQDVYRIDGPIGLSRLMELYWLDRPDLKDKPSQPFIPASFGPNYEEDVFALVRREDVLLHHPFESFEPIVEFLWRAARDPDVLAIKMTLYRVGRNSPIVAALLEASEAGKQVAVLVELKARFDEESNIEWARTLEDAGVHVVYGVVGMKVHSKIALVVRREGETIRRYVHLGTGNYNPMTARLYTDFGLLTCDEKIADDATHFFNTLTGYSKKHEPRKLLVAPLNMRRRLEEMILREISLQEKGEQGHLIFKMNSLEDPEMIRLLYRASQAGVKVDLLVRGLCCLRPGVTGISENIRVTSIVGRFLEHSRVFYFRKSGAEEIYLGSADLMRRNLSHRIEIIFPVKGPKLVRRLKDILTVYVSDEAKSHYLQSDGQYSRSINRDKAEAVNSQGALLTSAREPVPAGKAAGLSPRKRRTPNGHGNGRTRVNR